MVVSVMIVKHSTKLVGRKNQQRKKCRNQIDLKEMYVKYSTHVFYIFESLP